MVYHALKSLNPDASTLLFVENVGNLVCPALFDLGETRRVLIISVTEGEDKPLKYPGMFESAHLCLINKTDLLPHIEFNLDTLKKNILRVNRNLAIMEISARTGEGFQAWTDWLENLG
jgi:hydrogenase nickel incorporation protein HypB